MEGFGRAYAKKWSSKSLTSWSKEASVPVFKPLYHVWAGPLRVVGTKSGYMVRRVSGAIISIQGGKSKVRGDYLVLYLGRKWRSLMYILPKLSL